MRQGKSQQKVLYRSQHITFRPHFGLKKEFLSQCNKLTFVSAIIRAVSSHCELCNTPAGFFRQAIPPPLSSSAPRSCRLACFMLLCFCCIKAKWRYPTERIYHRRRLVSDPVE